MTAQSSNERVRFGVLLPTREAVMSGRSDPSLLYQLAERVEALGFHSMALCITGSWGKVLDRLEAFVDAGARTMVLRLAARDQFAHLENCAEALDRRGLLT